MRIEVDVHEQRSGVPDALTALGLTVRISRLRAGDYAVEGLAAIERKTVRDLHVSVIQGRLWRQLGWIRQAAPWRYLLVEGSSVYEGPLAEEAVRGLLVAVDDLGIAVIRARDARESAAWIARIAHRRRGNCRTVDRPVYAQRPQRNAHVSPPEQALAAAAGVSTVIARRLLNEFGSLIDVLQAPPQELRRVPGVGANRADAIHQLAVSN